MSRIGICANSTSVAGNAMWKLGFPLRSLNPGCRLVLRCLWRGPQSTHQSHCRNMIQHCLSPAGKHTWFCQVTSIHVGGEGFTKERHRIMSSTDTGVKFLQICHVLDTDTSPKHQVSGSFLHCLFGATETWPVGGEFDPTGPSPSMTAAASSTATADIKTSKSPLYFTAGARRFVCAYPCLEKDKTLSMKGTNNQPKKLPNKHKKQHSPKSVLLFFKNL